MRLLCLIEPFVIKSKSINLAIIHLFDAGVMSYLRTYFDKASYEMWQALSTLTSIVVSAVCSVT
jgi:hypothetical protein